MINIDFNDSLIEKLSSVIYEEAYYDEFYEGISYTKYPIYQTKPQLEKFFGSIIDFKS